MRNEDIGNKIDTCHICGCNEFETMTRFESWADEVEITMRCYKCDYKFTEIWKFAYNIDYKEEGD